MAVKNKWGRVQGLSPDLFVVDDLNVLTPPFVGYAIDQRGVVVKFVKVPAEQWGNVSRCRKHCTYYSKVRAGVFGIGCSWDKNGVAETARDCTTGYFEKVKD